MLALYEFLPSSSSLFFSKLSPITKRERRKKISPFSCLVSQRKEGFSVVVTLDSLQKRHFFQPLTTPHFHAPQDKNIFCWYPRMLTFPSLLCSQFQEFEKFAESNTRQYYTRDSHLLVFPRFSRIAFSKCALTWVPPPLHTEAHSGLRDKRSEGAASVRMRRRRRRRRGRVT